MEEILYKSKSTGMSAAVFTPAKSHAGHHHCLLYLHGAGGFGGDVETLFERPDLPRMLREGLALEMSVAIPVCSVGDQWYADLIESFVRDFFDDCPGNQTLSVAGFSRGASGVWRFVAEYPERAQNAIAIAGRKELHLAGGLCRTPLWLFHGVEDDKIPSRESVEMAARIRKLGGNVKLTLLENERHHITTRVFGRNDVISWLNETKAT